MKKIIISLVLLLTFTGCTKPDTKYICVNEKDAVVVSNGEVSKNKYLIYSDRGVYEITDSIFNMRFDSSDLYGKIKEGECYVATIDAMSWRTPFFSMYENIISVK